MPLGPGVYAEAAQQRRLWTPYEIRSSLAFWFDAMDKRTLTIVSGGGVSAWNDKSGNARNVSQATAARQPIWTPNVLQLARPMVLFTRASVHWMEASAFTSPATFQHVGVAYSNSITNTQVVAKQNTGAPNAAPEYLEIASSQWKAITFNTVPTTESATLATPAPANGVAAVVASDASSTALNVFVNGTQSGTVARTGTNATASAVLDIGTFDKTSGTSWDGGIGELLCTTSYLSTARRQQLEGYLAWKWGLQRSLAGTHPYSNRPPLIGV